MKYLIDTHILLWLTEDNPNLRANVKSLYLNKENQFYLSLASLWEMVLKISLKKLSIACPLDEFIEIHIKGNDIYILPIQLEHILFLQNLPCHHRDPFDRLIICQAIVDQMKLVSYDQHFASYPVDLIQ